jgi:probable rRNA maturation factor
MLCIDVYNASLRKPLPIAKVERAVRTALTKEKVRTAQVNVVFVNDQDIHTMNKTYLQHDYPTDVITFSLEEETMDGEIYISVETAQQQAQEYNVSLTNELMRLAIHGTLHLIGYDDATVAGRQQMHQLENLYLEQCLTAVPSKRTSRRTRSSNR